jgi:hypothetical protein
MHLEAIWNQILSVGWVLLDVTFDDLPIISILMTKDYKMTNQLLIEKKK